MTTNSNQKKNIKWATGTVLLTMLGIVILVPFASNQPDGLERVAEDLQFQDQATEVQPAENLPFAALFNGYELNGVPEGVATPLAGVAGMLITLGLTLGIAKVTLRTKALPKEQTPDQ